MPSKNISELYLLKRYPQNTVGLFTFILYLPFGILLLLLRGILGIQVFVFGFLLPDVPVIQKLLCKLFCATLGIVIHSENPAERKNVAVYVTNFVSPFDHLVIHSQTGSVMSGKDVFNTLLSTSFGLRHFGSQSVEFPIFKKNIAKTIESGTPVHFQPELKQTNGKAVLKFTTWPFQLCKRIQPVCIEVSRPFLDIKISTFDSVYWTDTLMYLFSPYTSYKLRFLPVVDQMDFSETKFADKVREDIAHALQVELSEYSATDLMHWEKKTYGRRSS
uniref:Phospholipid/glycerol acyltransferase domain-containing protein n=1 Tax=Photinus pyralis TaxID=7054 RepID=A0A1Y1N0H5_PHOPY